MVLTQQIASYAVPLCPCYHLMKRTTGHEFPSLLPAASPSDTTLSPEHMMLKHPLQNKWAMWFFKNDKNKDWASNLRYITSFDTVEDFWALYNHILPASKLGKTDISEIINLFKFFR